MCGANGFHEILSLTLAAGADTTSVNRFGGTTLLPSSEKGYLRTVQKCLEAGVAVNHMNNLGWSALLEAVILGNGGRLYSDIIQLLVDAGADVQLPDRDGKSSLQHAEAMGQEKVIRILNKEKLTIHPSIQSAQELARAEDFLKASLVMEHAMQEDSNNLDFYYYKGYFLGELGRYEEALAAYQQALTIDPDDLDFYFYTANAYRMMKRSEQALAEYDKAIERDPGESFFRYHKSNYLRELGRHEEAVKVMDQLLEQQPGRYDFSFHKANSLRSLGRHQEAVEAIENAIANDPSNPLYHHHKAQSLGLLGNHETAIQEIDIAISYNPANPDFHSAKEQFQLALKR